MSGSRLCAVLAELGFDGQDALDPDSFEWPFQYEEARPVLDWICSSLRPSNVLSLPELSQYEQFLHEGKLLEGEDLDSAFDSISAFSSKKDNQEAVFGAEERLIDIREAKLAFKAEVVELQKQLERQQSMFDLLASQASALIQGRRARVSATSFVNTQLITLDEKFSARNLEVHYTMFFSCTFFFTTQYEFCSRKNVLNCSGAGSLSFRGWNDIEISYVSYGNRSIQDDYCLHCHDRSSPTNVKGPLRLVAEEGKSKCSWVSLDDLTNCLIQGDNQKPHHHHHHNRVAELQRLRSIFATSERQWVEAQVENAKQQAILSMLKSQISSDEAHIHRDINFLRY
ncbi:hypothetical protein ZIOFF_038784 [Zingiber officinale]|uniref:HAUS augmin-like complex subunit 3 N-terminal domain-containing protein n=1 Tax=Zingiber officinale TaxID=94328 RepID=A0A8J5KSU6_ZINOF|nr:hypothetical protein ZIOFF_038784 [Zingiber officinale]